MELLITGAAGFIGSALTQALRTAGHTVAAVDDLSVTSPRPHPDDLQIRDVRSLTPHELGGVDTVVHLAAHKSVPASFDVGGFEHNVAVDRHLIHAFAASNARRLLLASSCEVYGQQAGALAEAASHAPRSPYAAGKAATEHLADIYRPRLGEGRHFGIVRFFNTFGPHEDGDAVVPAFLDAATEDRPLTIEGDGNQSRDLTHIDDAITMLTRILNAPTLLPVVNCGSGRGVSIRALADAAIHAVGRGTITHTAARPNEISSFLASTTLFTRVYGHIEHRPLDQALADTLYQRTRAWTPAGASR
ncbi:NAD-dependent epimerase/dehydratase family protein [Actinoalloteichus fjordicus]|uniref:Nucleoside-diphosphate-sugar epimerase n=1 Tax=Actinoalloteichus fjordicus TaxID=1612552 RepID=A0AAC9LF78_9PSEU|nr:NAD-dependent epimerase/dehydratase family protein [Actinoalloteichus fjordicus]APU15205.1 nucleoside-diphosphate-sugar epimerase [Actinoalloteichus fjordicus]